MSSKSLTESEKLKLGLILDDLGAIFTEEKIEMDGIEKIVHQLKSDEVKSYVKNLYKGSKPEAALREAFFAGQSILSQYLAEDVSPEINLGPGFIDYLIRYGSKFILLELKSLFEPEIRASKSGKEITGLKQKPLKWQDHKEQILKYINQGGEFIVITNLKEWYFFNDNVSPDKCEPFYHTDLLNFVNEFNVVGNLNDYLERHDFQAVRENLGKDFFLSLKSWVKKLNEVKYEADDRTKVSLILGIINKFIFIQTLDDYGVVDFRWIKNTWDHVEKRWGTKGKYKVLEAFFSEVLGWFYEFYDTELFKGRVLEFVKKDEENIEQFYESLKLILGQVYWQTALGGYRGIMQYNFRYIDEDIFGKAYETFLAEVRHDEGIYYTPSYITEHVVEKTVASLMDDLSLQIEKSVKSNNFEEAIQLTKRFTALRVLDPACGSGSFLVKACKKIFKRYQKLHQLIRDEELRINNFNQTLKRSAKEQEMSAKLYELREILKVGNNRELISSILLRHIHGNDLDSRALEVAKVNLWLESVKLAPADFRYEKLPKNTNRILPDLELNLNNGDAIAGLPIDLAIELLSSRKKELAEMSKLRADYILNPMKPEMVEQAETIRSGLRSWLDDEFRRYVKDNELPDITDETKVFHWPLEFWYLYFDENGDVLKEGRGADVIVGNPPYERIQTLQRKSQKYVDYLDKAGFKSTTSNYDLAVVFLERGYDLTSNGGRFGYIVTNKFMQQDYGEGIRSYLSSQKAVREIVDFGDQQVFENATTYTALIFLSKPSNESVVYSAIKELEGTLSQLEAIKQNDERPANVMMMAIPAAQLTSKPWVFIQAEDKSIDDKLKDCETLESVSERIFQGLVTGADSVFILKFVKESGNEITAYSKSLDREIVLEKALTRPLLKGADIKKWFVHEAEDIIIFPYALTKEGATLIDRETMKKQYHKVWAYFENNKDILENREPTYLFSWEEVPGRENERFVQSLEKVFTLTLEDSLKISKEGNNTLTASFDGGKVRLVVSNDKTKATLSLQQGAKKTRTEELLVKTTDNKSEIYHAEKWKGVPNWYSYGRRQNIEQFDQPKIMTQVLAHRSCFSIDKSQRYYFVGGGTAGGYGLTLNNKRLSLQYVAALLNSSLLDWKLRQKSSRFHSGYYSYGKSSVAPLPIMIPTSTNEVNAAKEIERMVDHISATKHARNEFLKIWHHWSGKLQNDERSLMEILRSDSNSIRYHDGSDTWFNNVSFYPDKKYDKELDEEYNEFEVTGNSSNHKLIILGFKGGKEEEIFTVESTDGNLLEHVYLSMLDVLNSRAKVKNLRQVLEKTNVPVIQPNLSKSTQNIMIKVRQDYRTKGHKGSESVIQLDSLIEDLEAKIDAKVFTIYGLNVDDIILVMKTLPIRPAYQEKVIGHFNGFAAG